MLPIYLKALMEALETAAGATTSANDSPAGRWKRTAAAAEALAGATTTANSTTSGFMLRTAVALESIAGTGGTEENANEPGMLKRIADALEVQSGEVLEGSLEYRVAMAAENATFAPQTYVTEWTSPASGAVAAIGAGPAWSNPGNILASDDVYATLAAAATSSQEIRAYFDFSALVPSGATITKVEVQFEIKKSGGSGLITQSYLLNGAAGNEGDRISADMISSNPTITTSDAYCTVVPTDDLWGVGAGLTAAVVRNANFGVSFVGNTAIGTSTLSMDHVQMRITYTA